MTRRERAVARLERRREWAAGRRDKAQACFAVGIPYLGDVAFNTQPGHIPERARVIRATERGVENLNIADHHESKAAGIESQLARTIFSDDENAVESLQAKIADGKKLVERMKAANKIVRKFKNDVHNGRLALEQMGLTAGRAQQLFEPDCCGRLGFASYQLTNLGANIRRMEKRVVEITRRAKLQAEAEECGGAAIKQAGDYSIVTFSEKPARDILQALRDAGFHWSGCSWSGLSSQLPDVIKKIAILQ